MDENLSLLRDGRPGVFALYVAASLAIGFAAVLLGRQLAK